MLPTIRGLIVALVLAAMTIASPASAKTPMGVVTKTSVTVRASASEDGAVVGTVTQGAIVALTGVKAGWVQIMWMNKTTKKVESGWIPISAVRLVSGGGGSGNSYQTPGGATFDLSVDSSDLDCREAYGGGFSDCTVTIRVSYDSDYNGNDTPNVVVNCDVDLRTENRDGWSGSESESERKDFYGKTDGGTIDVDFSFATYTPIINVKVDDVTCRISDVY
jgi:hypothetical protein